MPDQHKPLQGIRILVTRAKHQNQHLSQLIEQAGGKAIAFPVLEIIAPQNIQSINSQLSKTNTWDWIIFTSANAVNYAVDITNQQLPITEITKIAAIGDKTANCLAKHGITVDLIPAVSSSEGLASSLEMQTINNLNCLIIKGEGGRTMLEKQLSERGAVITTVDVYRRICPKSDSLSLLDQWSQQAINYVTVTSVEALNNLIQLIGDQGFKRLKEATIVVFSQRIHAAAINKGLVNVVIATSTSDKGIIESMVQIQKIGLKSTPRVQSD
ncbi:MAG: uroporphyrinogen-III synthase [Methylococcales bacterium]